MYRSVVLPIAIATAMSASPAKAEVIPPDVLAFLESVGLFLDENGVPVPPPAPPAPPAPVEPVDPTEADAALALFFEQIGLTLDESGNPVPPEPVTPPEPVEPAEPLTPEELSQLLGIPVELLTAPAEPPQPAVIETVPQPVSDPPIQTPADLEALFAELGLPGVLEPGPPAEPAPPVEPLTEAELLALLGIAPLETPAGATAATTSAVFIPEPASLAAAATALVALAAGRRPRRRT